MPPTFQRRRLATFQRRVFGRPGMGWAAIPCFLRHQLRFVDDGQPATANRRDRGGDLAVPEGNRVRSFLSSYSPYIQYALIFRFH